MFKTLSVFFLTITFVLFFYSDVSASLPVDSSSSKPYKISQKAFLKKYGADDSSRALINYYFSKRKGLRNGALLYASLAGAGYLVFNAVVTQASGRDVAVTGTGVLAVLLGTALALAVPLVAYRWLRTSRKSLFSMLNDYKMGKPIPEKVMKSSSFQRFLSHEKNQ